MSSATSQQWMSKQDFKEKIYIIFFKCGCISDSKGIKRMKKYGCFGRVSRREILLTKKYIEAQYCFEINIKFSGTMLLRNTN